MRLTNLLIKFKLFRKTVPRKKPSPEPKKDLKREMGEVNYRQWANNWDPVVDVQKVKPRVDTNVQKALALEKKEAELRKAQKAERRRRAAKSARSRKSHFDYETSQRKRRRPSKEEVYRSTLYAHNRYRNLPDSRKSEMREEWKHKSNIELLREKLMDEERRTAKSRKRQLVKMFDRYVNERNHELIEEQLKEGKVPGLYTAKLIQQKEKQKSKENQMERINRRKLREERNKPENRPGFQDAELEQLANRSAAKQNPPKPKFEVKNKDLRF